MATKVLNPQGWYRLYRATEIAALKHFADWLLRAGFTVSMGHDEYARFWLTANFQRSSDNADDLLVRASIRPHREGSGLWVNVYVKDLPAMLSFDGQDYMFMHDDAEGLARFAEWFDENRYVDCGL